MTPNGRTHPAGALNKPPDAIALAARSPHMYALDPAVAGVADVSGAAANTLVSSIAPMDPGATAAAGLGVGLTAAPPDIVPSSASVAGRSVAPSDVTVNVTCAQNTSSI